MRVESQATALDVRGLTVRDASGSVLVRDVEVNIAPGRALVLIGETGSGKSLVAQALLGLLPNGFSADGTIRIGSNPPIAAGNVRALSLFWAREVALVPQEPGAALDPTARVGRQLLSSAATVSSSAAALEAVDLPPETLRAHPFRLSGGMAQRVLVASALASGAPLVVADEPTKGLDPARVGLAIDLMRKIIAGGRSLLLITHDPAVARAFPGGTLAVMREGALVESGPAAELLERPRHPYTRAWIAADPPTWSPCRRRLACDDLVLAAHGLRFAYNRGRPLFENLDLHVPRSSVLALVGSSGSGKSTLGDVLLGLKRPSAGQVSWAGADPYRDTSVMRRLRRRYQKLHQNPATAFIPHRTIGRQLTDLAEIVPNLDVAGRVPLLLDRLKLRSTLLGRFAHEVSGGEAQRLCLARVLLLGPHFIVADEPTSRLDPIVQKETIVLLRELVDEEGLGLVLVSHDRALVSAIADEVLDLERLTQPERSSSVLCIKKGEQ